MIVYYNLSLHLSLLLRQCFLKCLCLNLFHPPPPISTYQTFIFYFILFSRGRILYFSFGLSFLSLPLSFSNFRSVLHLSFSSLIFSFNCFSAVSFFFPSSCLLLWVWITCCVPPLWYWGLGVSKSMQALVWSPSNAIFRNERYLSSSYNSEVYWSTIE